ncbi:sigma-54-dependent Fis family transcriptional regulator [Paradesulfitobacterium ferrireducens]|uniref:sigma-54-dependent Fis family transcriptional regulator n=1 Tax=Paradesulfitobacterium ferrireducens TaxID=2816476 RepID=UPI001A8DF65C|nr:sigma 54-interacting transcriptional regulator [Paradesulfitobacterium ferrireducens]
MENAWQAFISGREHVPAEVHISRSWQRSRDFRVSHEKVSTNDLLPANLLQERYAQNEDLVRASKNVLPLMFNFLQGQNYLVLLSDDSGYVLETLGDPPFLTKAQTVHLSPGANWREEVKGTNAIGTALTENIPLKVLGSEHYVRENHFLACWAAPIHDSQGKQLGVLDISGVASKAEERLLDIVIMGTRMIEYNLRLLELEHSYGIYREGLKLAGSLLIQGDIKIDSHGLITAITPAGINSIGRRREEILGRFVGEVFQSKPLHKGGSHTEVSANFMDFGQFSRSSLMSDVPVFPSPSVVPSSGTLWIGNSEASRKVLQRAAKVASTHSSVLIQGESGTGKEIIARHIHLLGPRRDKPFVPLNCAALPDSLMESELFGYVDGAFTGAKRGGQPGKFEIAQGGTIFLDEIGDISPNVQAALLRVLQEKEVYRIGATKAQNLDVRVIAATNKDLAALVAEGKFRLDLYYRLKVVTVELPPLRERTDDIFDLIPHFIEKCSAALGKPPLQVVPEVYSCLLSYSWPGNVRELENCIEGMVALADGPVLNVSDLPPELSRKKIQDPKLLGQEMTAGAQWIPDAKSESSPGLLQEQTREAIIKTLNRTGGKIAPAARLLGIGRNTLYRKMKELNITL